MKALKDLYIFPFNGNAIEAVDCIDNKQYNFKGFIDDDPEKQKQSFYGFKVFNRSVLEKLSHSKVLVVPGNPTNFHIRAKIISGLGLQEKQYPTVVHKTARVSRFATIGYNCLIMAGVVITSKAVIGNHVCILPNTVIHHDTQVGDYTLIGSNVTVAGNTVIGRNCYLGSCSSVINNIHVGGGSILGIGTNLIRSVPVHSKIVGNPGRSIL
jgi:sugar O-acyltransferase (sialic acid O-acetyltransferase NeuD family)